MFSKERISDPAIAFDDKFSVDSRDFLKVKLNLADGPKGRTKGNNGNRDSYWKLKEGRGQGKGRIQIYHQFGDLFRINLYVEGPALFEKSASKQLKNN
jgi:hypothetical protein